MTTVSIREAKNRLTELARRVEQGETVGGLDLAARDAYLREKGITGPLIPSIAPDFDEPLPEDVLLRPLPP